MALLSLLSKYVGTNANVVQTRMTAGANRTKSLVPVNGTDVTPLAISVWPLTKMWTMRPSATTGAERLENKWQWALSDTAYDIQAGDVLTGYPKATTQLIVASVNLYAAPDEPLPHLGGILREYSHQG